MEQNIETPATTEDDSLSRVAAWQFASFTLLIIVVWASEVMDWPALFFGASGTGVDIIRACLLTAAVIWCAVVTVGNTYLQQKRILNGMLIICTSCQKVKIGREAWEGLDRFVEQNTMAKLELAVCPDCFKRMEREISEANVGKAEADDTDPSPSPAGQD